MSIDEDALSERLAAVERAVTGGETDCRDLADAAEVERRLDELESAVEDLTDRVADLEAGTQALRGFVGGVDAVDRDVERRADVALAKAERLENRLSDRAVAGRSADGRSVDGRSSDDRFADGGSPRNGSVEPASRSGSSRSPQSRSDDGSSGRPDGSDLDPDEISAGPVTDTDDGSLVDRLRDVL